MCGELLPLTSRRRDNFPHDGSVGSGSVTPNDSVMSHAGIMAAGLLISSARVCHIPEDVYDDDHAKNSLLMLSWLQSVCAGKLCISLSPI